MGMEIGFNIYKEKVDQVTKEKILEQVEFPSDYINWCCGRSFVTYAWDYKDLISKITKDDRDYLDPVINSDLMKEIIFDKEWDQYVIKTTMTHPVGELYTKFVYVDFNEFKQAILEVTKKAKDDHKEIINNLNKEIADIDLQIRHYEDLQVRCATKAAFENFQDLIEASKQDQNELKQELADLKVSPSDPNFGLQSDYDYLKAYQVEDMLSEMEKYMKEKYIVTIFVSY